ncbi:hypothetical protein LWM68_15640 [Niabella sp. W65]|nr:hypothetical protein [Niabella sp. W65]MCH7364060.1 hypothetical protein [Niabella sp. W65]
MLVSVCTYLYKIANIPYYRQESSYLCYMYDMLMQMHEEEEVEPNPELLAEFEEAKKVGDIIESELLNAENLTSFEDRLNQFNSNDQFGDRCWQVAQKTLDLYREFPTMPLDNKFKTAELCEDDGDNYAITLEKYISFYASGSGWLADLLIDLINNDLQEYSFIEEPVIYQPLDHRKIANNDFDFEQRIFTIIDELTTLLYEYERLNP